MGYSVSDTLVYMQCLAVRFVYYIYTHIDNMLMANVWTNFFFVLHFVEWRPSDCQGIFARICRHRSYSSDIVAYK